MTFDAGTGEVPQPTAAAGGDSIAAPLEPFTPPAEPVQAPRVAPAKPPKPAGRTGAGTILLAVGLVVAVGGVAFAVGRVTAPASTASVGTRGASAGGGLLVPGGSFDPGAAGLADGSFAPGARGDRGLGGANGGLTGTVTAITADSVTIQVGTSGRTVEIPLDAATRYHAETPATASSVTVGAHVTVRTSQGTAPARQGQQGQGQQGGQLPQPSDAPVQGGVPGAGGPPGFTPGTATDVTVISGGAQ